MSDDFSTYNKLKNEYDNYVNTDMEQVESHSEANDDYELDEALKQKIINSSVLDDLKKWRKSPKNWNN